MDRREKEYIERYYTKKAIEYLKERGVTLTSQVIERAKIYLRGKNSIENYKKYRAKTIDSNFMKFVNNYESKLYCNANFQ